MRESDNGGYRIMKESLPRKHKVESITTSRKILGKTVSETAVKKETIEYVDLEDLGLKEKIKKTVSEAPAIPGKLRHHAESFISQIYADAKDLWNAESVGDVENIAYKAVYRVETDEIADKIGKVLNDGFVKPNTLLRLCNHVFSTPEGKGNKDFQAFLGRRIEVRMGIQDKEEPSGEVKDF